MTQIDKACYERGCACYDDRVDDDAVEVILAQPESWEKLCDSNCVWTDHHPDCKLAQTEQEPVAWKWRVKDFCDWPNWSVSLKRPADSGHAQYPRTEGYEDIPLYTHPPQRTEPVIDKSAAIRIATALGWEPKRT